jgi:hypothetical protein
MRDCVNKFIKEDCIFVVSFLFLPSVNTRASVVYRHRFDADPDPNFDADQDTDMDWHQNDAILMRILPCILCTCWKI